jgi:hypothetical protein
VQEIRESGRSVDDVCSDYAALRQQVRQALQRVMAVAVEVDAMFPTFSSSSRQSPRRPMQRDGWTLELEPRWRTPGARLGDFVLTRS